MRKKAKELETISGDSLRVSIPIFDGDERQYENWKSIFTACIDQAPATSEYKLLQLRQYLGKDALKSIEGFEHS